MHRILSVALCAIMLFLVCCGCSNLKNEKGEDSSMNSNLSSKSKVENHERIFYDNDHVIGYQLQNPEIGEDIAVMSTNMGIIKLKFFKEAAPKTVENFATHAKEGYYNNLTFHRIINDFMIQGGDPQGNGTGGESIWGTPFADEFSNKLFNVRGAVSMANSGKDTNGSQFFINQAQATSFRGWEYFSQIYDVYKSNPQTFESRYGSTIDMTKVTEDVKRIYTQNGGNPNLDGFLSTNSTGHTVFAQVFDGMDIVDNIAGVNVDSNNKPLSDVIIYKVEIIPYS